MQVSSASEINVGISFIICYEIAKRKFFKNGYGKYQNLHSANSLNLIKTDMANPSMQPKMTGLIGNFQFLEPWTSLKKWLKKCNNYLVYCNFQTIHAISPDGLSTKFQWDLMKTVGGVLQQQSVDGPRARQDTRWYITTPSHYCVML